MSPEAEPVKLFVAALWREAAALEEGVRRLAERWGPTDFVGPDRPFDSTDYYEREMGSPLHRRLVAFAVLLRPEEIVPRKHEAMGIERDLGGPSGRTVNLDAGYLDVHKVVLASAKPGPQKIFLGGGVWADMVSRYSKGAFHPFEWSFPDFRCGRYDEELLEIRRLYRAGLRRRFRGPRGAP